jgi:hypothetical protein|tara:strand:- start:15073 stop:15453 length:381 start_codon:yes stop_codon:yes gene_type:complete
MKRYYKYVTPIPLCRGYKYTSWGNPTGYNVEYRLNEWAKPKLSDSGLLVFDTLKTAKLFIIGLSVVKSLFLVDTEEPIDLPPCRAIFITNYRDIWKNSQEPHFFSLPWPEGTLAFRRVKLLEEISL